MSPSVQVVTLKVLLEISAVMFLVLMVVVLQMAQQVALNAEVNTMIAILQVSIIVKLAMHIVMSVLVLCKLIVVHAKMRNMTKIPRVDTTVSHNLHVKLLNGLYQIQIAS